MIWNVIKKDEYWKWISNYCNFKIQNLNTDMCTSAGLILTTGKNNKEYLL